jgi:Flp pilus assembly pilin Flp
MHSAIVMITQLLSSEEQAVKLFWNDQSGATAIEYGFIAAAMGVVLVVVMPILASQFTVQFSALGSHIASGK